MPFPSGPNDYIKKIVKKEGESSLNLDANGFVTPLYVEVPELFNNDGPYNFTKKKIANKYDLCYLGMNPLGYQGIAQNRRLKNVLALL
jgi:hypothetical protein